jgi:glycerol-3-phosphate dehydrogenase
MTNTEIARDLEKCSQTSYDLIVVGGGIYGVMLAYEAARRKLRTLVLEKNDFISGTSLNHLRTVHGGLRYLQSLDLPRFKESVGERKWYLKHFSQYVKPMPCIMPLYGKGLHRNPILWAGITVNDILSFNRNADVSRDQHLPRGKIFSAKRTREVFPGVDSDGLTGSARWWDANIEEFQRLMMDVIHVLTAKGSDFLNYVDVTGLKIENDNVTGVRGTDCVTGDVFDFNTSAVINAAGPWCREIAARLHKDHEPLFKKRLLVWNILFRKDALSDHALGLTNVKGGGHTYFFHPWKNRLLVGTGEVVVEAGENERTVPPSEIRHFLEDMNKMIPGINLTDSDIQRVYTGILPANEDGRMSGRELIFDHSTEGGPKGLFSVSGVKFTTARLVSDKVVSKVFPGAKKSSHDSLLADMKKEGLSFDYNWKPTEPEDFQLLKELVEKEAVLHLSDLILRRTSLGDHPERALDILPSIRHLFEKFHWDDRAWENEVDMLKEELNKSM